MNMKLHTTGDQLCHTVEPENLAGVAVSLQLSHKIHQPFLLTYTVEPLYVKSINLKDLRITTCKDTSLIGTLPAVPAT